MGETGARAEAASEFEAFVRARTPALLRAAYLLTGDRFLAEDLVQSALARTHLAWQRLHVAGNAEAYTRTTMYHLQVSWWRRRRVAETLPGAVPEIARDEGNESDTVARLSMQQALLRLTDRQRAVLVLRYFEDRTEAETAAILNCAIGTVKSQTAKALAKLRATVPELAELDVRR